MVIELVTIYHHLTKAKGWIYLEIEIANYSFRNIPFWFLAKYSQLVAFARGYFWSTKQFSIYQSIFQHTYHLSTCGLLSPHRLWIGQFEIRALVCVMRLCYTICHTPQHTPTCLKDLENICHEQFKDKLCFSKKLI